MFSKPKYYQIKTNFSQEEVFKILYENTAEKQLSLFKPNKEFLGGIYKDHFIIEKVISGRNSFNPIIKGDFNSIDYNKTLIEFRLNTKPYVSIFSTIWLSFVIIFFIASIVSSNLIGIGISLIMIFYGAMLFYLGPLMVQNKILETFENLFQSKTQEIHP